MLTELADKIEALDSPAEADFEQTLRAWQEGAGLEKLGPVVHPVRVALTGRTFGPGLWELMAVLGKEKTASRLRAAGQLIHAGL